MTPLTVLAACACMYAVDVLSSLRNVSESRGRAKLAGLLDAGDGLASITYTVFGAGSILKYGWHGGTFALLACLAATDFLGTSTGTWLGTNIKGNRH